MTAANESGDSAELEALFDSIASVPVEPPPPPPPKPVASLGESGDSTELEALFDSISSQAVAEVVPAAGAAVPSAAEVDDKDRQDKVFNSIGQMARQLHDTLRELGYDKMIEDTVHALPDAKDRLAYIANLTEQAACRVLNATDIAQPIQDQLSAEGQAFAERWDRLYANQLSVAEFKQLADETRAFFKNGLPEKVGATNSQLMEIMMAQDFQDLTGQVIKKIISLAQTLESQLMKVLIEVIPGERRNEEVNSLLNGPVINAEGRTDVVVSQQQVDDLLDSLGF